MRRETILLLLLPTLYLIYSVIYYGLDSNYLSSVSLSLGSLLIWQTFK